MPMSNSSALRYISLALLVWVLGVIVLGAYTRLADAGLGCPDWPTCYGHLWVPNSLEEIESANKAFSDTPVETDKTWPEQLHRLLAKTLGLLVLLSFFLAHRHQVKNRLTTAINSVVVLLVFTLLGTVARIIYGHVLEPLLALIVFAFFANIVRLYALSRARPSGTYLLISTLFGLVVLQGLFGMWTVTLKLWPQVVTAHLLGGFATLSLIAVIASRLWFPSIAIRGLSSPVITLARLTAICVLIQVALGGWVSSNYAALACPDLPTCQNQWLPDMDMRGGFNFLQDLGPNYLGGKLDNVARIAIHFSHRVGAIIVSILAVILIFCLYRSSLSSGEGDLKRHLALIFSVLLLTQVALGISNIALALPLSVAVLHNAVGALLLMALVVFNVRISRS